MSPLAHPLTVGPDGMLAHADDIGAVAGVIEVMWGTSRTLWPHAPWFGLHEAVLEASRRDQQDHEALKDLVNKALTQLGVTAVTVQAVRAGPIGPDGKRAFQVTLLDGTGTPHPFGV